MNERFSRVYVLPNSLYQEGAPIEIHAGAILKDAVSGSVMAQFQLKNVSEKNIIGITVQVTPCDVAGRVLGDNIQHQYLDFCLMSGNLYGYQEPFGLPYNNTRLLKCAVTEVVFDDRTVWSDESGEWIDKPIPEAAERVSQPMNTIQQVPTAPVTSAPQPNVNIQPVATGPVTGGMNPAQSQVKKAGKTIGVILASLAAVCVLGFLIISFGIPAIRYSQGEKLMKNGQYSEAVMVFADLGVYRDSPDRIVEAMKAIAYRQAEEKEAAGDLDGAIDFWTKLGDYSDSAARIENALYQAYGRTYEEASAKMDEGDFRAAEELFAQIPDYEDAQVMEEYCRAARWELSMADASELYESGDLQGCALLLESIVNEGCGESQPMFEQVSYEYGMQLMEEGNLEEAVTYLETGNNYLDTTDMRNECYFALAEGMIAEGRWSDALDEIALLPEDYNGVAAKANEAKYGYVLDHLDRDDVLTGQYLDELMGAQYKDAASLYHEMYAWTISCFVNDAAWSLDDMETLSKFSQWCFHYTLGGGPDGAATGLNAVCTFPSGDSYTVSTPDLTAGEEGVVYFYYNNPAYGSAGTCTVNFYDGDWNLIGSKSVYISN